GCKSFPRRGVPAPPGPPSGATPDRDTSWKALSLISSDRPHLVNNRHHLCLSRGVHENGRRILPKFTAIFNEENTKGIFLWSFDVYETSRVPLLMTDHRLHHHAWALEHNIRS
ncbi:hypothetical protein AVEN_60698-1, partial [Araneus ventricosus]